MDERFAYSITPRKRINSDSFELRNLRMPKTLMLTKKEAYDAIISGAIVYRRFGANSNIRVNITNLNRLHKAEYNPNEEQSIEPVTFDEVEEETVVEEPVGDIVPEEVKEEPTIIEEPKKEEEVTVVEEAKEEVVTNEEVPAEEVVEPAIESEPVVEESIEEAPAEEVSVEDSISEEINNTQNTYKKNNKKHH